MIKVGCEAQVVGPFTKARGSDNIDECVSVAPLSNGGRAVAHSRHLGDAELHFTSGEWGRFVDAVKAGEFD